MNPPTPRRHRRRPRAGLAVAIAIAPAVAAEPAPEDLASASLVAETTGVAPGGTTHIAVVFEVAPEWHLYWKNSGDTGLPIGVELTLPPGYTAGEILWPPPARHEHSGLVDFILEGPVALIIPLRAPAGASPGDEVAVHAALTWLVCKEECHFGEGEVKLTLPVQTTPCESANAALFADARARAPRAAGPSDAVAARWSGAWLELEASGAERLVYSPDPRPDGAPFDAAPVDIGRDGAADGGELRIEYGPGAQSLTRAGGVLEVTRNGEKTFFVIDIPGQKARPE